MKDKLDRLQEKEIQDFCAGLDEIGIKHYHTQNGYTIIKDSAIAKVVREARIDEWDFIWDFMEAANDTAHNYLKEITNDRIKELQDGK